jgi:suppressor for copper-sensitivity B
MRHRAGGGAVLRGAAAAGMAAAVVVSLALAMGADAGPAASRQGVAETAGPEIPWIEFDRAEAEALAAQGELVFVDVTADWCFTCKANERLVLETPETRALFEEHRVVAMKADWTNRDDDIAAFLAEHGKYSIPFYLLYRPGQEPHPFSELLTKAALQEAVTGAATPRRTATLTP